MEKPKTFICQEEETPETPEEGTEGGEEETPE